MFNLYGPALLSEFPVTRDFRTIRKVLFHDYIEDVEDVEDAAQDTIANEMTEPQDTTETHAIIMVGYKVVENVIYILCQNWWKSKQFFEMSASYFDACNVTAYFVITPQTKMKDNIIANSGFYFESNDEVEGGEGEYED